MMSLSRLRIGLIHAMWLCGLMASPALAQTTGFLHGLVVNVNGEPLPGVVIVITRAGQGVAGRGAVTDKRGSFQVAGLPPGRDYSVRASLPGSATVTMSEISVSAGEVSTVRLTLSPETAVREHVEVRATPAIVDLAQTTTQTSISAEFIDALPLFGRNYQEVLTLAPGVSDVDGDGNPNIHGARDTDMITLVDGVSTTDPLTGKAGAQMNLESIQEIEIKTSGATAEFSRAQGGFANIITKSGGNEFEGAFKFFWRGSLLDGDGAGIDDARLHAGIGEIGLRDLEFNDFLPFLSLGGPLVKDRAWFFVTSEYIQKQDPVNALSTTFVREMKEWRLFVKLTWQATIAQRLSLSLNYDPQEFSNEGLNGFTRQESGYSTEAGGTVLTLKSTTILSPLVALESSLSSFDGRPALVPNLGRDTNGNGLLYDDRNGNGFGESSERDPGDDFDQDGAFDVFEDFNLNRRLDPGEDRDGDGRLTGDYACEGDLREDSDCDGRLDDTPEQTGLYGIFWSCNCEWNTDLDHDGRQDPGTEDRNHNGILDDEVRPSGLYPYGRRLPQLPDRDYLLGESVGIISGPYFKELDDRRRRVTLRQDLSVYVPDARGSHDVKVGWSLEREQFERTTKAGDIIATIDDVCGGEATVTPSETIGDPPFTCVSSYQPTVKALLPTERSVDNEATGTTGGLYVQDNFKPIPNLSLGLGLRFDRERTESVGYTPFEPVAQRAGFDRLSSLIGGEIGLDDFLQGNNDDLNNLGILADPIWGLGQVEQLTAYLTDPIRLAAAGRLTRHHSENAFLSGRLAALFPGIFGGDRLNLDQLLDLGIQAQVQEKFALTNNNLAPRLSFSWDPGADGKTKVFATWGRYYDKLFLSTIVGEAGPDYLSRYYDLDPDGLDIKYHSPLTERFPFDSTPNHYIGRYLSKSAPSTTQVDRQLRTPFSDEFSLGFEREIAPEVALTVSYINRRFRDQLQDIDVNHTLRFSDETGEALDRLGRLQVLPGGSKQPLPDGRPDLYLLNPFFNQVLRIGNTNEARYSTIEVALKRRLSRRWQMQGSYAYSRAVGAAEDFQSRLGNDPSTVESEFGYLDYDQRHVVKLFATTFLPHDWQIGTSVTWASGLPYSIVSRFFALDNEGYQQFRTRFGYTAIDPETGPRFVPMPRNSGRNDAVLDLNLSARKSFVLGRASAAAVVEIFNVLNTDDLRVFTYEPSKGEFKPGQGILLATPLQLDAERRFGRRFQIGLQLQF